MLQVSNVQNGIFVDTVVISLQLHDDGILQSLHVGKKSLVINNNVPLLMASILESSEYDGWRDYAPGRIVDAAYQSLGHEYAQDEQNFEATYTGRLDFGEGDSVNCELKVCK